MGHPNVIPGSGSGPAWEVPQAEMEAADKLARIVEEVRMTLAEQGKFPPVPPAYLVQVTGIIVAPDKDGIFRQTGGGNLEADPSAAQQQADFSIQLDAYNKARQDLFDKLWAAAEK